MAFQLEHQAPEMRPRKICGPDFFVDSNDHRPPPLDRDNMVIIQQQHIVVDKLLWLAVKDYLKDIKSHMQRMETETLPNTSDIDRQPHITWSMRPCLIDFLIDAHAAFALRPGTLFLTINLVDRYCSKQVVHEEHYQLVGSTALWLAAKYDDKKGRVPRIHELRSLCDGLYDADMFVEMEMRILKALDWFIGYPTVDFFLPLIAAIYKDDEEVEHMAAYLCEIALYYPDFASTRPSTMARSSLALARIILGRPEITHKYWDPLEKSTLFWSETISGLPEAREQSGIASRIRTDDCCAPDHPKLI
ncbi:cyclin domain-containing [Fusarium albosuccineum]|uniref:Cyclin domain-containing n=1 Tax=Fusarium albosuccineum TaxID=1237068 RepID=A0A8H4P5A5_9HYPO|nr:cyclin domain-containing [Fusarium albosuccineum]